MGEDGAVIMNQKSRRNKAMQAQKPEEEEEQKLAKEAPTEPLDKEDAAETIQSARKYIYREGAVEAKKVHTHGVFAKSGEANSSVPNTFTHSGWEKEATPKGRAEKATRKKKEGKDAAVQKAKAEDRVVLMNQKSCRNKAMQAQKPEEEEHQKRAKEAPTEPLDKEGAAETIQSARKYIHLEGAVEAKKAQFEKSDEANSSV